MTTAQVLGISRSMLLHTMDTHHTTGLTGTSQIEPALVDTAREMARTLLDVRYRHHGETRTSLGHVELLPGRVCVWCTCEFRSTDAYRQWIPGEARLSFSHDLVERARRGEPWTATYLLREANHLGELTPRWIREAVEDLQVLLD